MAEPVERLRLHPSELEGISAHETVERVIARGRRRRAAKRAMTGTAAIVGVGALILLSGVGDRSISVDSVGIADQVGRTSSPPTSAATPVEVPPSSAATDPNNPDAGSESPTTEPPSPTEPGPRVELELTVTTDERSYWAGQPVTTIIEACNNADRDAVEYFADRDSMFRLRIDSADDRTVALGFHPRDGQATQTWKPGECRRYSMTWDQREGEFGDPSAPPASPGTYTAVVDWFSTDPPPPGMDPGLYDPAMPQRVPATSRAFTIADPGSTTSTIIGL